MSFQAHGRPLGPSFAFSVTAALVFREGFLQEEMELRAMQIQKTPIT